LKVHNILEQSIAGLSRGKQSIKNGMTLKLINQITQMLNGSTFTICNITITPSDIKTNKSIANNKERVLIQIEIETD